MNYFSESLRVCCLWFLLFHVISAERYAFEDEPECKDDCFNIRTSKDATIGECQLTYKKYYSYKLVRDLFNFGKSAVYAGIWAYRYEKPDLELFDKVFQRTLNKYKNENLLGNVDFEALNATASFIYESFKPYTIKRDPSDVVKHEFYPDLPCPTSCLYEQVSWQTLFYLAITIFILSLTTVILYSVSLRSQYLYLKNRLGNGKASNVKSTGES